MRWFLVQIESYWNYPYWVRKLNKDYWENSYGEHIPRQDSDIILGIAEGEYEDLDHAKTALVVKRSDTGWLSRTGQWYPCKVYYHDIYAKLILKMNYITLIGRGWVQVFNKKEWYCRQSLSSEQHEWLLKHNHQVEEHCL